MLPRVTGTWGWVHRPAVSLEHGYLSAVAAWSPIGSEQVLTAPRLRVHAGACVFRAVPCERAHDSSARACVCVCAAQKVVYIFGGMLPTEAGATLGSEGTHRFSGRLTQIRFNRV